MLAMSGTPDGDQSSHDTAIVARVRAGDEGAFCDLYATHALSLVRYAATVLGDYDTAEDAVQDVFMSLWERRAIWEPRGSILSYVYRAVRNRVLDIQSHRAIVGRTAQEAQHDLASFTPRIEPTDERLVLDEQSSALAVAIAALPERRRVALLMRAVHGAEYSEIADTLGVTEQAVRILVARARESLRHLHR